MRIGELERTVFRVLKKTFEDSGTIGTAIDELSRDERKGLKQFDVRGRQIIINIAAENGYTLSPNELDSAIASIKLPDRNGNGEQTNTSVVKALTPAEFLKLGEGKRRIVNLDIPRRSGKKQVVTSEGPREIKNSKEIGNARTLPNGHTQSAQVAVFTQQNLPEEVTLLSGSDPQQMLRRGLSYRVRTANGNTVIGSGRFVDSKKEEGVYTLRFQEWHGALTTVTLSRNLVCKRLDK